MHRLTFIVLIFLLVGCGHQYRHFEYHTNELELEFGRLIVHFSSAEPKQVGGTRGVTEYNQPFGFRVVFVANDNPGRSVQINVISATPSSSPYEVYKLNEPGVTGPVNYLDKAPFPSGYVGLIQNLNTDHKPVTFELEIIYDGNIQNVTLILEPYYYQQRRPEWFDGMMSV